MNSQIRYFLVFFLCFLPALTSYFSLINQKNDLLLVVFILSPIICGIVLQYLFIKIFKNSNLYI